MSSHSGVVPCGDHFGHDSFTGLHPLQLAQARHDDLPVFIELPPVQHLYGFAIATRRGQLSFDIEHERVEGDGRQARERSRVEAAAEAAPRTQYGLGVWLLLLAGMALAPFVLTMVTSFVKIVVVLGILLSYTRRLPLLIQLTVLVVLPVVFLIITGSTGLFSGLRGIGVGSG